MSGEGCGEARRALGVYLLGAISPADRSAVGRHLAGCADCRDELAWLASLPGLLDHVPAADLAWLSVGEDVLAGGAGLPPDRGSPLDRPARRPRRRRWHGLIVTAAVTAIAAGGAVAGSRVLYPPARRPAAPALPSGTTVRGSNPRTGAGAAVRYAPQPWGLELDVRVSRIPAGTTCELEVINSRGREVPAGGWMTAGGGGWYPASSPFSASAIRGFAVTSGGKVLVSIPIR